MSSYACASINRQINSPSLRCLLSFSDHSPSAFCEGANATSFPSASQISSPVRWSQKQCSSARALKSSAARVLQYYAAKAVVQRSLPIKAMSSERETMNEARPPSEVGAPQEQWSAEHYAANMRFVADLASQPLIELLAPQPGERILDLGCGDGPLMAPIASHGCTVVGVDYSEDMIDKARAKGLDAHVADGQSLTFDAEFDAVFTNAALHWMKRDPDGVIEGVKRALKPGGRFVGEFGGHGNVAAVKTALLAVCNARGFDGYARIPWYFPTVKEYSTRLEKQGFEVGYMELIPRPTPLPTGMEEWFTGFGSTFFEGMDEEMRKGAVAEGLALLKPSLCDLEGKWTADYARLRFAAKLKV